MFDEAVTAIQDAHALVGAGNLLPQVNLHSRTTSPLRGRVMIYSDYREHYYSVVRAIGLKRNGIGTSHGLRHAYLNKRVEQLIGGKTPVQGGRFTTPEELASLRRAYRIAADEAGHGRHDVAQSYCGRIVLTDPAMA